MSPPSQKMEIVEDSDTEPEEEIRKEQLKPEKPTVSSGGLKRSHTSPDLLKVKKLKARQQVNIAFFIPHFLFLYFIYFALYASSHARLKSLVYRPDRANVQQMSFPVVQADRFPFLFLQEKKPVPEVNRSLKPKVVLENTNHNTYNAYYTSKDREQRLEPVYSSVKNVSCFVFSFFQMTTDFCFKQRTV